MGPALIVLRAIVPSRRRQMMERGSGKGCGQLIAGLFAAVVALAYMVAATSARAADSAPAMITPGQFNVGSTGQFSYDVPVAVPPGTAGMAPSLSLDYSSQGGDGVLGYGWALGGLPSIGRCPRTLAQDGVHGGINYDLNDRFCMNGQRLILVSGTYGASGSQYRTEIDGFSQITAYGSSGNGPAYFEVQNKSGQTLEFGATADSQSLATGTATVRAWSVDKITDSAGNYLTVTYTVDSANGVNYPLSISYTGNAAASLTPYNSVQFSYISRPDVTPFYQAGSLTQRTQLLSDVKTYAGSTLVSDYKLAYTLGSSTSHSELTSISHCDGSGNCLPPTTFGWQGSRNTPAMTALPNGQFQGATMTVGALSGLGLTDVFSANSSTATCGAYYGTQTAGVFTSTTQMTASYEQYEVDPETGKVTVTWVSGAPLNCEQQSFHYRVPVDINGDGLTDAIIFQKTSKTGGAYFVLINNGANALIQPGQGATGTLYFSGLYGGDFNGDGLFDLLAAPTGQSNYYVFIGDGAGNFTNNPSLPITFAAFTTADFDGDGCTDIAAQHGGTGTITYSCNPAVATTSLPNLNNAAVVTGDFNGDGKTDFLVAPVGSNALIYLSTGTGFTTAYTIPNSSDWYKYSIVTGDWNGDGKTDIALIAAGTSGGGYGVGTSHTIWLSTGTGFSLFQTIANTNPADTTVTAVTGDFNNDGAADLFLKKPSGDTEYLFSYIPEMINTVSNGIGVTTTVTYDRLNHGTIYTKETGDAYPTQDLIGPLYAVSRIDGGNAVGGVYSSTYSYSGARYDLHGRGFLGYHTMTVTDLQTGVVQTTTYGQSFPYIGLITAQTKTLNGAVLNATTNTFASTPSVAGTGAEFVYPTQTVAASNDLDGSPMPTVTNTYNAYDSYGNPTQITVSTPDGASKVTNSSYTNDTAHWYLGRLMGASVTSTVGASTITRTSSFAYDPTTGLLNQEVVEPNTAALRLETDYGYDAFGNKHTVTVSGGSGSSAIVSRTTTSTYDSRGQFATTIANALNQSETWAYSSAFGLATSHTGPNGLTTTWQYDSVGRKVLELHPDGTEVTYAYAYCSGVNGGTASCPVNGAFLVTTTPLGSDHATQIGPVGVTYYDALSRVIANEAQGFDGTVIHTDSQYDAMGRPYRASQPYFVGASAVYWTTNSFDALGRVISTSLPNGGVAAYAYHGLTTSVTDANNHTTTTVKNDQGLAAQVTDAASNTASYVYDAMGDTLTVTDSAGNVTTNTYDTRGRKTATSDPDKGAWSYAYDVLNELISQTNAKLQTSTVTYDVLGRMTQRVEVDLTSTWTYDTAAHGIGLLASATTNGGYSRTLSYDALSRPITTVLSINGVNGTYSTSYASLSGKLATVAYPSGLTLAYSYNAYGYQSQIADNGSGQVYWTANARDQFLHLTTETAGNGMVTTRTFSPQTGWVSTIQAGANAATANFSYQFDLVGNLTQRVDAALSRTDGFAYDALNRLSTYSIAGGAAQTIGYDALGDITSKPGIGTYNYPAAGQARPHGVSSITGTVRGVVNPSFSYDADGNTLSGPAMTATYTSYDMASTIATSGQGQGPYWGSFNWGQANWAQAGGSSVTLTYNAEHQRMEMVASAASTFYFNDPTSGAVAELYAPTSGPTQWRDYVMADGRMIAERTTATGGATTWQYFVADHLGSIAVVTDGAGNVSDRMIYDPWGLQLSASGADLCGVGTPTTRGFTGEEQMPLNCLVNLNARVYDPVLGRFLTGDPVISSVYDQQALNRYSYVHNNPLSLTDTDGECGPFCAFIIVAIVDLVATEVLKPVFEHNPILGDLLVIADGIACGPVGIGPLCAAEGAASVAGVESGKVGKALEAFALTFAEGEAFDQVGGIKTALNLTGTAATATSFVLHGLIGGTFSVVQGGQFGSGFLSAGVADLASPYILQSTKGNIPLGTAESAILGGATSVITGGKFENGAITGSFGYLFNDLAHAWAGTQATYALADSLNNRDGSNTWKVNANSFLDALINGFVDIINVASGQAYEVKTNFCLSQTYCAAAAEAQLQSYVKSSSGKLTIGNFSTVFSDASAILSSRYVMGVYTQFLFNAGPANSGLIGYNVQDSENIFQKIWQGYKNQKSVTPLLGPPAVPILGVL